MLILRALLLSFVVKQHVSPIPVKNTDQIQCVTWLMKAFKYESHMFETDRHITVEGDMVHIENNLCLFDRNRDIDMDLRYGIRPGSNCRQPGSNKSRNGKNKRNVWHQFHFYSL